MKTFWREYGLLGAVIVVSMAGYLYYQQNRQDVMAYSLDTIGDSLISMVDPAGQSAVARLYDRFKRRVLEQSVAPEDVENVAVNVLNLSNSGSTLTEEEAELVLGLPFADYEPREPTKEEEPKIDAKSAQLASPVAPERIVRVPSVPRPLPAPIPPKAFTELGERLHSLVSINREVHKIVAFEGSDPALASANVQYDCEDGIKITIDDKLKIRLGVDAGRPLAKSLRRFEKQKRLVWKQDLAKEVAHARETHAMQARTVQREAARDVHRHQQHLVEVEGVRAARQALAALKKLETMGYLSPIDIDSVMVVVERELSTEGTR